MSSETLRPGAALGAYPEREEAPDRGLERVLSQLLRRFAHASRPRASRVRSLLERIDQEGKELSVCSEAGIGDRVRELRSHLSGEGLTDPLVARSFALIRELAERTLGMRHFDVQLIGGEVLLSGRLAEMETGEGKTLTATLAAATAALAGIPVHVITSNDYLASRDAETMRPLYQALGLSVGTITHDVQYPDERRANYACDITYSACSHVVFDYLRDRMVLGQVRGRRTLELEQLHDRNSRMKRLILRGLCFAIVDEADDVLIDQARTPLILSREHPAPEQERIYREAMDLASQLEEGEHFRIELHSKDAWLTEPGTARLADLARPLEGVWTGWRRREELVRQALRAQHLYHPDRDYLLREDKVQIIDPNTGRVLPDRTWEAGLHQMIEVKEGCAITGQRETLARITYQRFFRRYLRLAGMTGTAREVAGELRSVYGLEVVAVPTHRPVKRRARPTRVHTSAASKWEAAVARVLELHGQRRPVLVGTCSVEASEHVSRLLCDVGVGHQLLNARQDREEAEIVACAGEPAAITVATNMAGRGTDIKLGAGVPELGGLHVIATERSEARRIDRQLFGRCGRQGDPGSFEAILSLEDPIPSEHWPRRLCELWLAMCPTDKRGMRWAAERLISLCQRSVERRHAQVRRDLLRRDEQLDEMLAFAGHLE